MGNPMIYVDPTGEMYIPYYTKASRIAWKVGIIGYLYPKGLTTSAGMLWHSLQDNPEKWVRENNSTIVGQIRNSGEYKDKLNEIKDNLNIGILKNDDPLGIKFTTKDLSTSIGKANVDYTATENEDGTYNVDIQITDKYNFEFHLTDYEDDSFTTSANNAAWASQYTDTV